MLATWARQSDEISINDSKLLEEGTNLIMRNTGHTMTSI